MPSHDKSQDAASSKPRFLLLDFVRFLAAFFVVLYHYTSRDDGQWPGSTRAMFPDLSLVSSYGYLGVQLFFIVSGFVIFMSTEGRTVSAFIAARIGRIYPAYWIAVIITASLQAFAPALGKSVSVSQVLVNLTMFEVPARVPYVDDVYWTLWIELMFYVLMAILMACGATRRGYIVFLIVWPVVMLWITEHGSERLVALTGAKYASFFAVGMCLYLIHKYGLKIGLWLLLLFNALIGLRNTLKFTVPSEPTDGRFVSELGVGIVVVVVLVAMAVLTLSPLKHRGYQWMTAAGALTYPLYLTHHYWGLWIIANLEPAIGKWVTLAIAVLAALAIAYVVERWVERPARPRLRRLVQKALSRD